MTMTVMMKMTKVMMKYETQRILHKRDNRSSDKLTRISGSVLYSSSIVIYAYFHAQVINILQSERVRLIQCRFRTTNAAII